MRARRWPALSLRGSGPVAPLQTRGHSALAWLALALGACGGGEPDPAIEPAGTSDAATHADAAAVLAMDAAAPAADAADAGAASAPARDTGAPPLLDAGAPPGAVDAATPTGDGGRADANLAEAGLTDAAAEAATADGGDLQQVAAPLQGLILDVTCAAGTPTPLANGATCLHPTGMQHMEKAVTLGGEANVTYTVTLRVRGVWEPTLIQGGQRPDKAHPFTIGGMPPPGTSSSDPINYQQYSLQVSAPKQTYWLNDHQYVAHAIHKEDYQATLRVAGGARVTMVMNDGNERQIANFTQAYFEGVLPYDKAPSLGQSVRLDVVSVSVEP